MDKGDSSSFSSEDFDLGRLIRILLMQSKIIFLVIFLTFAASIAYYMTATKTYKVSSLLQVYQDDMPGMGGNAGLDFFLGGSDSGDIENLITLYSSRTNLMQLVRGLQLNIRSSHDQLDTSGKIDFIFDELRFKNINASDSFNFFIKFEDRAFELYDLNNNLLISGEYNKSVENEHIIIKVKKPSFDINEIVKFSHNSFNDEIRRLKGKLKVANTSRKTNFFRANGLIQVDYTTSDVNFAERLINLSNEIFINDNKKVETERARLAIEFIDQRLASVKDLLEINKTRLKEFQEDNKSLNVDLEIQSIIETISTIDSQISALNVELSKAENTYTDSNPFYVSLINQRQELADQKDQIENRIKNLPLAQQNYIDLFRDVEISQGLFSELTNRKLSYSIMEASTIGNIRIVDDAFTDSQISPTILIIFFNTALSSIFIIAFCLLRGLHFTPISNPAELRDNGITNTIIGVMPKFSDEPDEEDNQKFIQSIESTLVNLELLEKYKHSQHQKCKVILFSSPTSENGKSLISREIALSFNEKLKKRTLLIDNDLKRGDQHKAFGAKKIQLDDFMKIDPNDMESFKVDGGLYLIPCITRLDSSFQFIYSDGYREKLELLKEYFDVIIIDTGPILGVSDTAALMSYADINIGVVRHGKNKLSEINQMMQLASQTGKGFDGLIYNDYQTPKGYYGYYGLYMNYEYQYYADKYLYKNYDYESK